jgi:hypothetical protein
MLPMVAGFLLLAPAAAQEAGVAPVWVVRKDIAALVEHVERMKPIVEQAKPEQWTAQGAPAAYVDQGKRLRAEVQYLLDSAKALNGKPDRLTFALDTYFRLQSVDQMLESYGAGIRKYQNAPLADLLQSALNDSAADRDKLRQYIMDLAADQEHEFRVADEEAQRCRAMLLSSPRSKKPAESPKIEERK